MLGEPDISRMSPHELASYAEQFPKENVPLARWSGDGLEAEHGGVGEDVFSGLASHEHDGFSRELPYNGYKIVSRTIRDFRTLLLEYERRCAKRWGDASIDPKNWPSLVVQGCVLQECNLFALPLNARIMFFGCRFLQGVNLSGSQCKGEVTFNSCQLAGRAVFGKREFCGPFKVLGCAFREVHFTGPTFREAAEFRNCCFHAHADFAETQFLGGVHFGSSEGTGSEERLTGCKFEDTVSFDFAAFRGPVSFRDARFAEPVDFTRANLSRIDSIDLHGLRIGGRSVLMGDLRMRLDQFTRERQLFPFGRIGLILGEDGEPVHGQSSYGEVAHVRKHMRRDAFLHASDQYSVLAGNFSASTEPDSWQAADFCHSRYFDLRRHASFLREDWGRWLKLLLFRATLGNGVYLRAPLLSALLVIVVFALLFAFVLPGSIHEAGRSFGTKWGPWAIWPFACLAHTAICNKTLADCANLPERVATSLYFSAVTFTTIGYGDLHPAGWARLAAAMEGVLGVLLMTCFTVILVRKIIR